MHTSPELFAAKFHLLVFGSKWRDCRIVFARGWWQWALRRAVWMSLRGAVCELHNHPSSTIQRSAPPPVRMSWLTCACLVSALHDMLHHRLGSLYSSILFVCSCLCWICWHMGRSAVCWRNTWNPFYSVVIPYDTTSEQSSIHNHSDWVICAWQMHGGFWMTQLEVRTAMTLLWCVSCTRLFCWVQQAAVAWAAHVSCCLASASFSVWQCIVSQAMRAVLWCAMLCCDNSKRCPLFIPLLLLLHWLQGVTHTNRNHLHP